MEGSIGTSEGPRPKVGALDAGPGREDVADRLTVGTGALTLTRLMTRRIEQVESTLQRAIASVLQRDIADPRIRGMVSITRVKVSPDLAEAQVFVSIMPARFEERTMSGLHRATGRIRRFTHNQVALKTMPQLRFELDQSLKKQARVFQALDEARQRTGPLAEEAADAGSRSAEIELDPPMPDEPRPRDA